MTIPKQKAIYFLKVVIPSFWVLVVIEYFLKKESPNSWRPSTLLHFISSTLQDLWETLGRISANLCDLVRLFTNFWEYLGDLIEWICKIFPIREFLYTARDLLYEIWLVVSSPVWYFVGYFNYLMDSTPASVAIIWLVAASLCAFILTKGHQSYIERQGLNKNQIEHKTD